VPVLLLLLLLLLQDAGISRMPGFKAYDEGNAAKIWIKDYKGQPYVGQVGVITQQDLYHSSCLWRTPIDNSLQMYNARQICKWTCLCMLLCCTGVASLSGVAW
jgi:hypothetical protein